MLPANNIGDQCATVDKVLRSLAMPTSVTNTCRQRNLQTPKDYTMQHTDAHSIFYDQKPMGCVPQLAAQLYKHFYNP